MLKNGAAAEADVASISDSVATIESRCLIVSRIVGRSPGTRLTLSIIIHPSVWRNYGQELLSPAHQPLVNIRWNGALFHPLEDLNGLLGGVAYHPAVGTFGDVALQLGAQLGVGFLVEVVGKFLQKFFTCKQRRRLPCA